MIARREDKKIPQPVVAPGLIHFNLLEPKFSAECARLDGQAVCHIIVNQHLDDATMEVLLGHGQVSYLSLDIKHVLPLAFDGAH
jgi:hypothetical protein